MEQVGFRKTCRGYTCTVNKSQQWWWAIRMGKQWTWDHAGCDVRREGVLCFSGVKTLADAVLLAIGWETALGDVWTMAAADRRQLIDACGRGHALAQLVAYIRENSSGR